MRRLVVLAVAVGALAVPALSHAAAPPIARPNPVTYPIRLDYERPLAAPDGSPATLTPLGQGVIMAATRDQAFLAFEKLDDLGGFVPAPVGRLTLTTGGRDVLPPGVHTPQIPLFQTAGGGTVSSFTFTGAPPSGPTPPPDNGNGGPQPPPPPTPGNSPPPANQGFGGTAGGSGTTTTTTSTTTETTTTGGSGGDTTTTTRRPPTTTTPGTTTTSATTTTAATTTTGGGGGGGRGGGGGSGCSGGGCAAGSCGTAGIQIDSAPPGCVIGLGNAKPGDSVSEVMTITNTSGSPYTLQFRAIVTSAGSAPPDLEMDVYDPLVGPASPMPLLSSWLGAFHTLTTLAPGATIRYGIELYLPTTAGNADQGKSVTLTFDWLAG